MSATFSTTAARSGSYSALTADAQKVLAHFDAESISSGHAKVIDLDALSRVTGFSLERLLTLRDQIERRDIVRTWLVSLGMKRLLIVVGPEHYQHLPRIAEELVADHHARTRHGGPRRYHARKAS